MKTCGKCGNTKEHGAFHKRSASKDGLSACCKVCQSEYDKARADLPKRVIARREYMKTPEGKLAHDRARHAWIERNPKKRRVHVITGNAIRSGALTKSPCESCGAINVCAHHDDYDKPLEVRWLCPPCHARWHKENGEGKNSN